MDSFIFVFVVHSKDVQDKRYQYRNICLIKTNRMHTKYTPAAAKALQPIWGLALLYALAPQFSVFGCGFPSSYAKQREDILSHSTFPSFAGFSLALDCLLHGFLWQTMLHEIYIILQFLNAPTCFLLYHHHYHHHQAAHTNFLKTAKVYRTTFVMFLCTAHPSQVQHAGCVMYI